PPSNCADPGRSTQQPPAGGSPAPPTSAGCSAQRMAFRRATTEKPHCVIDSALCTNNCARTTHDQADSLGHTDATNTEALLDRLINQPPRIHTPFPRTRLCKVHANH